MLGLPVITPLGVGCSERKCFFPNPSIPFLPLYLTAAILQSDAMVAASELKAMNWPFKNPKFIFFTDFDGTITLKDSNDFMVETCIYLKT